MSAPRYWNLFRRPPSGRNQKRILNRATTCPLCRKPLDTNRAFYKAYTAHTESKYIAAHPTCADQHMQELTARLQGGINQMLRTFSKYGL